MKYQYEMSRSTKNFNWKCSHETGFFF